MTTDARDPYEGELPSDADLDPTGTTPDADTGDGYVDPVEQKLEDQLPQGHASSEPNQLP